MVRAIDSESTAELWEPDGRSEGKRCQVAEHCGTRRCYSAVKMVRALPDQPSAEAPTATSGNLDSLQTFLTSPHPCFKEANPELRRIRISVERFKWVRDRTEPRRQFKVPPKVQEHREAISTHD